MIKLILVAIYIFNLSTLSLLLAYRLHIRKDVARGVKIAKLIIICASVVALGTLTQPEHPPIRFTAVAFTSGVLMLELYTNRRSRRGSAMYGDTR